MLDPLLLVGTHMVENIPNLVSTPLNGLVMMKHIVLTLDLPQYFLQHLQLVACSDSLPSSVHFDDKGHTHLLSLDFPLDFERDLSCPPNFLVLALPLVVKVDADGSQIMSHEFSIDCPIHPPL